MDMNNPPIVITQPAVSLSQRVLAEQIKVIISQPLSSLIVPVIMSLSVLALWGKLPHAPMLLALFVNFLSSLWFDFYVWRNRRRNTIDFDASKLANGLILSAAAHGISCGLFGLAIYVPDSMPDQMFSMAFMFAFTAGAVMVNGQHFPTCAAFAAPNILPIIIYSFYEATLSSVAIGTMGLLGLINALRMGFSAQRRTINEIQLRFKNIDLMHELERQKAAAEFARAEAESANLSKSRFLAAASHDLRQPVHALGLFVSAARQPTSEPERKLIFDHIENSVESLTAMFDSLLDVSRLDAGILQAQPKTVALASTLKKLAGEFTPQAHGKNLKFCTRCPDLLVRTDPLLFERMLRNLITNSIHYTSSGGILLAGRKRGDKVVVEVWDSGIGIASDQQTQVFEEFYQVSNPERDRRQGVGLGLAIVKRLAKLLQHPLRLDSRLNQGTRFSIELPISKVFAEEGGLGQRTHDDETVLFGAVIAVIDDEADILNAVELLLKQWGCVVIAAGSGAQAQEKLHVEDIAPDLILSDYRLRNNETGIDAIQKLRAIYGNDVPALLVTGDTAAQRLRDAAASGLQVLHKPLNAEQLKHALIKMLA